MLQLHRYESVGGVVAETIENKAHFDALVDAAIEAEQSRGDDVEAAEAAKQKAPKPPKGNAAREQALLELRTVESTARRPAVERARARFLKESEWFLWKCVSWFRGDDVDDDDLMQTAAAAFWQACCDWQPGRAPLLSFARWRLRTALRSHLRSSRIVRGCDSDVLSLGIGGDVVDGGGEVER